jgi:hypothetical protein
MTGVLVLVTGGLALTTAMRTKFMGLDMYNFYYD